MNPIIGTLIRHHRIKALSNGAATLYLRCIPLAAASGHVSDADVGRVMMLHENGIALMRELAASMLLIENTIAPGYELSLPETLDGAELFAWGHETAWASDTDRAIELFAGRIGSIDEAAWSSAMDEFANERGRE